MNCRNAYVECVHFSFFRQWHALHKFSSQLGDCIGHCQFRYIPNDRQTVPYGFLITR